MSCSPRPRGLTIRRMWPLLLLAMFVSLLWGGGCARPKGMRSSSTTSSAEQPQVPFHDTDGPGTDRPGDSFAAQDNSQGAVASLPFHEPQNLPAGTLLTVRLKAPISGGNPSADATFEAVVDQPVVIDGSKLIPRGVAVSGRVESARTSSLKRNRGYVRLVLDSINLSGASLRIQTASLFVRGSTANDEISPPEKPSGAVAREPITPKRGPDRKVLASDASSGRIHLEKGRLLTFRLTEPVYVAASQRAPVDQ